MNSNRTPPLPSRRRFLSGLAAGGAWLAAAGTGIAQEDPLPSAVPLLPAIPALAESRAAFALGGDRFIATEWRRYAHLRLGLVTNQTGVLSTGEPLVHAILRNPDLQLRALFSPEHGMHGNHTAGSRVQSSVDALSGLPVRSLYGKTRRPTAAMLDDIDVLLFDIQDVGARTYTYISTLAMIMQAAQQFGKAVCVLDRPNPIGGTLVEGPVLEPAFASFVGLYPLPMRHGMTVGEIAQLYREQFGLHCRLEVISMNGYTRKMLWPQTRLPWIPTSPNIPHFRTALAYLATGPLGAANINNGVGSPRPFELALGPGLNGELLAQTLAARDLPGVRFEPASWTPQSGFWTGTRLEGIALDVIHPAEFLAVHTALEILAAVHKIAPDHLRYGSGFDRDWGTASVRRGISAGDRVTELQHAWAPRLAAFRTQRKNALLYT